MILTEPQHDIGSELEQINLRGGTHGADVHFPGPSTEGLLAEDQERPGLTWTADWAGGGGGLAIKVFTNDLKVVTSSRRPVKCD